MCTSANNFVANGRDIYLCWLQWLLNIFSKTELAAAVESDPPQLTSIWAMCELFGVVLRIWRSRRYLYLKPVINRVCPPPQLRVRIRCEMLYFSKLVICSSKSFLLASMSLIHESAESVSGEEWMKWVFDAVSIWKWCSSVFLISLMVAKSIIPCVKNFDFLDYNWFWNLGQKKKKWSLGNVTLLSDFVLSSK